MGTGLQECALFELFCDFFVNGIAKVFNICALPLEYHLTNSDGHHVKL